MVRPVPGAVAGEPVTSAGPVAQVVRGGVVESEHLGHLLAVAVDGAASLAVGDPDATILPRSSLKPLQAVAMLEAGLDLDDTGLALACASHSGTAEHLAVVRGVLRGAGLGTTDLRNTPDLPLDREVGASWLSAGEAPSAVAQNCSGKHAAMLATCVAAGWDTATYLDPEHPLQQAVRRTVERLTGVPVDHVVVDGCGAPLLSSTVRGLARAFARLASAGAAADGSPEARVAAAMTAHPWLVGGPGRDVTDFMAAVPGLVVKDGAEGVCAAGLPDGRGIAFKVADGAARPRPAIMAAALEALWQHDPGSAPQADVLERVRTVGHTPVLGHGRPVGAVRAVGLTPPGTAGGPR